MLCYRKVKFIFLLLIAISVFFLIAITVIPFLISTDAIRLRLARELSAWTGYNVQLREPPRISIFPSFQASLSEVTLSERGCLLMKARRVEVDISLYGALTGRVLFLETRIINPHFTIGEPIKTVTGFFTSLSRSEGTLGITIRRARSLVSIFPKQPAFSQLPTQPFGRILIEGGTLTYPVSENGETSEITNINSVINWPESEHSASLRASGYWHGEFTNLNINIDQMLFLMGGSISPLRISINSDRGGIAFTGLARLSQNFLLNGHFSSHSPSWNRSMAWIGASGFFGASVAVPIAWESSLNIQPGHIELNNIIFTLGKDTARGALEITFQNNVPVTTGSLAFKTLDLNQVFPILFTDNRKIVDFSSIKNFGLDLRLSISKAAIQSISVNGLATSIQIRNDRLVFDIGHVQIFNGVAQVNIQLQNRSQSITDLKSRLSLTNIDLSLLQKALGKKKSILIANANLMFAIQSTFSQWTDFFPNANGNLTVNLSSGVLTGFNVADFIQYIKLEKAFLLEIMQKKAFRFDKADGEATIGNGQIKFKAITLHFGEKYIDMHGCINYLKDRLNFVGVLDGLRTIGDMCIDTRCVIGSLVPVLQFSIRGTWTKPIVSIHGPMKDQASYRRLPCNNSDKAENLL